MAGGRGDLVDRHAGRGHAGRGGGDPGDAPGRLAEREEHVATVARAAATEVYRDFLALPPDGVDEAILRRTAERVQRARDMASAAAEIDARDAGRLDDEAVREYLSRLDLEEAALMSRMSARL